MKRLFFAATLLLLSLCGYSQNYQLTTGDEVKMRQFSADMDIVTNDKTGLYFAEQRWSLNVRAKLYKFDKNYNLIYDKLYKKELRGAFFHSFQPIDEELIMFSTDYTRKEKTYGLFAQKVNKSSGEINGEPTQIAGFSLESKRDDFDLKFTAVEKGKKLLYVANVSNDDRVSIIATVLNSSLQKESSATINFRFSQNQFSIEDVFYSSNGKFIILGKESEETQVGKRRKKSWVFKQYILFIYTKEGKKEKEITMNVDQRFAISGKLIEQVDGTVALAGFYANDPKKKDLNGFFLTKIDTDKNELLLSSYKEINSSMIGHNYTEDGDEDEDDKKAKNEDKKNQDDDDDIPNEYVLKSVLTNPTDNSLVITAEISQLRKYLTNSGSNSTSTSTMVYNYITKDILLVAISNDGKVKWINTIPKNQEERYSDPNISGSRAREDYFSGKTAHPYYSSFASLISKEKIIVLVNDHQSNNVTPGYGDKVKRVANSAFKRKSNLYGISIDLATGVMTRKFIHENSAEGIMMPRIAYINKSTIMIPSLRLKRFGKNEFRMNQLTIK